MPAGEAAGLKPRAVFSPGSARLAAALGCSGAAPLLPARSPRLRHSSCSVRLQARQGSPLQPLRAKERAKILSLPRAKMLFSRCWSWLSRRKPQPKALGKPFVVMGSKRLTPKIPLFSYVDCYQKILSSLCYCCSLFAAEIIILLIALSLWICPSDPVLIPPCTQVVLA